MDWQFCKVADIPHLWCSQILCLLFTQGHRFAEALGYGYVAPLVLWLSVVIGIIAF
jgi:hypothetical protein